MKKLFRSALCLVLALSLLLCLCACGEDQPDPSEPVSGSEDAGSDEAYSLSAPVENGEVIPIPDENLRKALRTAMNLPDEYEITTMHAIQLMYLDLRGLDIRNLDGLQYCLSLEVLYIGDNQIKHLDALKGLEDLFILDFSNNRVKDVTPILGLSNLMFIDPTGNPLEDESLLEQTFDIDKTYVVGKQPLVPWE